MFKKDEKIHLLGSCGTFMAGLAHLCHDAGLFAEGSDDYFEEPLGPTLPDSFKKKSSREVIEDADSIIIGNKYKRSHTLIKDILSSRKKIFSCMELLTWLIKDKKVIAVAGTHGKTTTSSLISWILEYSGLNPGFLIGGLPKNFSRNARLTESDYFVIESDEYDTSYFDKRSKFLHLWPHLLVLNHIEFDHADIFKDFSEIQKTFDVLLKRMSPGSSVICAPQNYYQIDPDNDLNIIKIDSLESYIKVDEKGELLFNNEVIKAWPMLHGPNILNLNLAIMTCKELGISDEKIYAAISSFKGVYRRSEFLYFQDIKIIHDFGHHPTAIKKTLECLPNNSDYLVWVEKGSNTMKSGKFDDDLMQVMRNFGEKNFFFYERDKGGISINDFLKACQLQNKNGMMFSNHPLTWKDIKCAHSTLNQVE